MAESQDINEKNLGERISKWICDFANTLRKLTLVGAGIRNALQLGKKK